VAADVLIVEEAGGKVTDHRGGGLDPDGSEGLVASSGLLHPDLIRVTREYLC
jgi:myo-inositol-1(or 4)-monophosphatase